MSEDEGEGEGETQHEASAKPEQPSSRSRSKNKKQKKSKQGRKGKDEAESAHDVDIDAALKDLGLDAVPSPAPAPQTLDRRQTFTFDINTKLLSPDEGASPAPGCHTCHVLPSHPRERRMHPATTLACASATAPLPIQSFVPYLARQYWP